MSLSKFLIKNRKIILVVWIIAFIASVPALMSYSGYISYNSTSNSASNSESAIASQILSNVSSQNQSLIVLVQENPFASTSLANSTLAFQEKIAQSRIANVTSSISPYSFYADLLNNELKPAHSTITSLYEEVNLTSRNIYLFPSSFYNNWSLFQFSKSNVWESAVKAGYNGSNYEKAFISNLNESLKNSSHPVPYSAVMNSINKTVESMFPGSGIALEILGGMNFLNYTSATSGFVAGLLHQEYGFKITKLMVAAVIHSTEPGYYYVSRFGLNGATRSMLNGLVDKNSNAYIILINFNSPANYIEKNGSSPSQAATPAIETLTLSYFGKNGTVTGDGAISYQTQKVTSSAGIAFAFIYVILAIAVFLTLRSYKASIITLVIVSLATAIGYVSIFISGLIFHSVNYVVNYTLTAVILGVSTDYFVFVLARYRQEIREGKKEEAIYIALDRAGKSIFVSGVAVSISLGMFSIVPGFRAWGSVLAISIFLTVLMEVSILPFIIKALGPKLFMKSGIKPLEKDYQESSLYYKISQVSTRRKFTVVALILILAAPAMYMFFTIPTTYNFDTGLPNNLSSVKGLNQLEADFGSNLLYPVEVIVPLGASHYSQNLSVSATEKIRSASYYLNQTDGIANIVGPYYNNMTTPSSYSSFVIDHGQYAYFQVYLKYSPYSSQAIKIVQTLRDNKSIIVGGLTSSVIDQKIENQKNYTELALLIIASIGITLFIAFRSLKYPLISILGVFISISWTVSILYLISTYLLHQSLIYLIPIILFVILMSLGNDYSVFIISRIREEISKYEKHKGIAIGMVGSGKVVTALGLILAASLGVLAFIPSGFLEQLGIAFIISLILDTFVIRTFFFPAMISIFTKE